MEETVEKLSNPMQSTNQCAQSNTNPWKPLNNRLSEIEIDFNYIAEDHQELASRIDNLEQEMKRRKTQKFNENDKSDHILPTTRQRGNLQHKFKERNFKYSKMEELFTSNNHTQRINDYQRRNNTPNIFMNQKPTLTKEIQTPELKEIRYIDDVIFPPTKAEYR
jgi:CMP-N-acetylneuraminic acid synthetase